MRSLSLLLILSVACAPPAEEDTDRPDATEVQDTGEGEETDLETASCGLLNNRPEIDLVAPTTPAGARPA